MATIPILIKHGTPGGDVVLPDVGNPMIEFYPVRQSKSGYERTGESFQVPLTAGAGTVILDDTPYGYAIKAVEHFPGGRTWFFVVSGDSNYEDLGEIDPTTLSPVVPPAVWQIAGGSLVGGVYIQSAKTPDLLIVGDIVRDVDETVTFADVVWPDGTVGTFTTDEIDASGAINAYHITYGSPAIRTYTQPAITRDSAGAATYVPQIVVS